jgi:hypothetical protein
MKELVKFFIGHELRPHEIEPGLVGYIAQIKRLEEMLIDIEADLQVREARRKIQKDEVCKGLNENIMKAYLAEYDRIKAKTNYLLGVISGILGEKPARDLSTGQCVTDAEIERARQHPIENLIESKRGMARCISGLHDDRNPSMDVRNNFAYCYACGFYADAIGIYQKLHGVGFREAVEALQ